APSLAMRLVDATTVKEPGKTGSLWRIPYAVCVPSLLCDPFLLTATEGDRHRRVVHTVSDDGGYVLRRVNTGAWPFRTSDGRGFNLLQDVRCLQQPRQRRCACASRRPPSL
ncbi:MAG: hypothetical protein OXC62_16115, partial [Aestuariivita sp.]|nr:hypothetical protein [Aestuariivita sp.]